MIIAVVGVCSSAWEKQRSIFTSRSDFPFPVMKLFVCFFVLLISSVSSCYRCPHRSTAKYFSSSLPLTAGACGYKAFALNLSHGYGYVFAGVPSLYREGFGCGACYQIRCMDASICDIRGTEVVLIDLSESDESDLVLSRDAFASMAQQDNMRQDILNLGLADVEYRRIPCDYEGQNMLVRIEEFSQFPKFLAIKFLYQGGQTDILDVEIAPVSSNNWTEMTKNNGAVWHTNHSAKAPQGPLKFRILIKKGFATTKLVLPNAITGNWKIGAMYNTGAQLAEIAEERCSKTDCDDGGWK